MQHRLIWFRDDLRVTDNAAVCAALDAAPTGSVRAIFVRADREWDDFGIGPNRLHFTEHALRALAESLAMLGVPFLVLNAASYDDQVIKISEYCHKNQIAEIYFNHEYQINERRRDQALEARLAGAVRVLGYHDRLILPPGSVLTGDGRYYSVFSPFKRRWMTQLRDTAYAPYTMPRAIGPPVPVESWEPMAQAPESDLSWIEPSESAAQKALGSFIDTGLTQYDDRRNAPSVIGTSRLSPYLARGLLSPRQCVAAAEQALNRPLWDFPEAAFSWINELIWREFYHHLLVGFPRLSKSRAFKPETEALVWRNDSAEIEAWKNGQTGIPIVDAGMRELARTGWMHNRVRMIVAQFLTKNLWVDWRIGEAYFMRLLVDSDLAANNGGWQWSASTGTDAAPYFRVFNPISQSEAHDPEARYITKWIPELARLPVKKRHDPSRHGPVENYPSALVDLKSTRARAIASFKELSS